jgi:hypothetical protein
MGLPSLVKEYTVYINISTTYGHPPPVIILFIPSNPYMGVGDAGWGVEKGARRGFFALLPCAGFPFSGGGIRAHSVQAGK